ncbi:hypothetical protein Syun_029563 [Stephania yunnanensis]|uniref:Prefoldin subunit 4 n=1 Tax=Stephania yunnanensis TaxID=152371 RepID=A0AAP0E5T7_9MAGN
MFRLVQPNQQIISVARRHLDFPNLRSRSIRISSSIYLAELAWNPIRNQITFSELSDSLIDLNCEEKGAKEHHGFEDMEANESLEDAGNELILTDDEVIRFQIGEVFAHMPKEEVEERIEQMKKTTSKNLEKLEEEKNSVLAQMAELKKILYGKFKDSINLEDD